MWRSVMAVGLALGFGLAHIAGCFARDVGGARDHRLLKRFPNSTIVRYEKRASAQYTVPMGPLLRWDYARAQPDFGGKYVDLEGDVTRITYVVRRGVSAAQVFRSFKNDLFAKGFKIAYEAEGAKFGRSQGNLYRNLREQLLEFSPKGAHFLSAKLDGVPAAAYVALYLTEFEIGATTVKVRPGQVVLQLDVIEVAPVSDKLVVVSASDISKGIESSGRVALYGIMFDL